MGSVFEYKYKSKNISLKVFFGIVIYFNLTSYAMANINNMVLHFQNLFVYCVVYSLFLVQSDNLKTFHFTLQSKCYIVKTMIIFLRKSFYILTLLPKTFLVLWIVHNIWGFVFIMLLVVLWLVKYCKKSFIENVLIYRFNSIFPIDLWKISAKDISSQYLFNWFSRHYN